MMAAKKRKKGSRDKRFRKTLRQSTHPIPPGRVEESKVRYDRSRAREEAEDEIERETEEDSETEGISEG
ncbi:MAG: hypothetical protein ACE5LH_00935 [Fidelibacterota bacterium]